MMLMVEILLIIIGIKWKTCKQTENCRKNEKSPQPTGNWLRGNWKHSENSRKKLKFSLKNCKIGRQGREDSPQSARQKSPTALKRLDISIKCASKMARRFCRFCAIQQKQPMTSFCHGLMAERKGFEPLRALGALHDFQSCALDQLSHLSIYSAVSPHLTTCYIIASTSGIVKQYFEKNQFFSNKF